MNKFLALSATGFFLALLALVLWAGYSEVEMSGRTIDAVEVRVKSACWGLGTEAEIEHRRAIFLALAEIYVRGIYEDKRGFEKAVAKKSPCFPIGMETNIPTDVLQKLKAN